MRSAPRRLYHLALAFSLAGSTACGLKPYVGEADPVPPPPDLPLLTVTAPERASFVSGPVPVVGRVERGTGAVTSVELLDESLSFNGEGYFEAETPQGEGIVILGVRAEDDAGQRAVDGRAVHMGVVNEPGVLLKDALGIQAGRELLDDDDRTPDDVAGLVETLILDDGFAAALVGFTQSTAGFDVTVQSFEVGDADVDIVATDEGLLELDAELFDVVVHFTAVDGIGLIETEGVIEMDSVELQMDIAIDSVPGEILVDVPWSYCAIDGFTLETDLGDTWDTILGPAMQPLLEQQIQDEATTLVDGMLGGMLSSFAVDLTVGSEDQVGINMALARASVSDRGIVIWLDGKVWARSAAIALPTGAGSLQTKVPGPGLPASGSQALTVHVDDDFVNQALFAFWQAGMLGGYSFSGTELALLTGEPLAAPLGPAATIAMDAHLPAVVRPGTTQDFAMDLSLGEFVLAIEREDGQPVEGSLNVRVPATPRLTEDGLSLQLDNRPANVVVHVGMLATPENLDPGDIASMLRLATPTLLSKSAGIFPGFPAPEIPVGELLGYESVAEVSWGLDDPSFVMGTDGWMVIKGDIAP